MWFDTKSKILTILAVVSTVLVGAEIILEANKAYLVFSEDPNPMFPAFMGPILVVVGSIYKLNVLLLPLLYLFRSVYTNKIKRLEVAAAQKFFYLGLACSVIVIILTYFGNLTITGLVVDTLDFLGIVS